MYVFVGTYFVFMIALAGGGLANCTALAPAVTEDQHFQEKTQETSNE